MSTNHCCGRSAEECAANPTEHCAGTFLKWVREAGAHHCSDEARAERQADNDMETRIAALQCNLADEMVERLRLVETNRRRVDRIAELEAQLAASHLAAQRMAVEAVAEEREACAVLVADFLNRQPFGAYELPAAIRARGGK